MNDILESEVNTAVNNTEVEAKPYKRGANGRFIKGTTGGGRKPRAAEENLLARFKSAVTDADLDAITKVLVKKSIKGDLAAVRLLLNYLYGLPRASIEQINLVEVVFVDNWAEVT